MKNEIIIILGRKGSGKTHLARQMAALAGRLIVFDPQRQFTAEGVVINDALSLAEYLSLIQSNNFRVIYQPEMTVRGDVDLLLREFNFVCRCVGRLRDVLFVIDEIDRCVGREYIFKNLVQTGRHNQISIVATTIRYTDATRDMTAQADTIISFQCTEPGDVRYFRDRLGDMAERLPSLPPYHYIRKDAGVLESKIYVTQKSEV
jgi:energy-coupling factor transporter ATP-binding protein EcfA2